MVIFISAIIDENEQKEKENLLIFQHENFQCPLKVCSFWLRDHCRCSICYGDTSQKRINLMDIHLDIEPMEIKTENDSVCVTCK